MNRPKATHVRSWWRWARPLAGATVIAVLVGRIGAGAVVDAVRATDVAALAAGAAIAAGTTTCAAWRWRLVARALRVDLSMPSAIAACYRAQFLNATLPGGVLGDVERGVHHGRRVEDLGRGLRAVAWERTAGQVVLAMLAGFAMLLGGWSSPRTRLVLAGALVGVAAVALVVPRTARAAGSGTVARAARITVSDARGMLVPPVLTGVTLASLAVVAGHVATFTLAARTVGIHMPLDRLVPLALVVLVVAGVPVNLAGWGPREAGAAWAFAAAGAGAGQGLRVAVAYGAIVLVATLPGAVVLVTRRRHHEGVTRA